MVFPHSGEAFIYLKYSGDLLDAAQSIPEIVCSPPSGNFLYFTAGTANILVNARIIGGTSAATARIAGVIVTAGALADNNGEGIIFVDQISGTWALGENITVAGPTTIGVCRSVLINHYGQHAKSAVIQAENESARVLWNGHVPTNSAATPASYGFLLTATGSIELNGWENVRNLKFINAVSTANSVINVIIGY